jgi:type I restriction-modification system DNA methylase subunit
VAIKKSELYNSLWKSCDELRGGMDASQYKDYVLVLLFVKYVSDKYAGQRGRKLGRHGSEVLAPRYRLEARQRAMQLEPVIIELKRKGLSLAKIAGELNKQKVATPRGGRWDHSSVRNVLQRLDA